MAVPIYFAIGPSNGGIATLRVGGRSCLGNNDRATCVMSRLLTKHVVQQHNEALATKSGHVPEVLDALPAAVYLTDKAGRITFYNEAAATLWGCRPAIGSAEWCGSWRLYWPDGTPLPHDQCPMRWR